MLFDTGFEADDRDARRIYAATQQAGLKKIDYLVISHYHTDHVGGLSALSEMIPIGLFYGRGDEISIGKRRSSWSARRTSSARSASSYGGEQRTAERTGASRQHGEIDHAGWPEDSPVRT
jgi:glyoxylase-like metal-dependent hydrolase (beta-lactamase superfamily II)